MTDKVVPIKKDLSPQFLREFDSHVEKSWDMSSQDAVTNELWSAEFKAFLDGQTLKSLFFSEDWVFITVDLIANKISSRPLRVMQKTVVDGVESLEAVPDHPLNELLRQPNEWQDYAQWMYQTCVELYLMGNAIVWNAPKSGQLITLQTENISMDFDNKGQLSQYMVTNMSEDEGVRSTEVVQEFKPKEVMHMRRVNPSSLLWGLSPFVPGRKSILFNRYSTDYLNAFYLKQATPGMALKLDRSVNEDVALRQLRSFEVAYQGRKNMRRTFILPKGVEAQTLTHSLSDQKLLDHIDKNRETILGLFKIPKHELSLQTAGSLGSEEYKIALRNFWEATLIPGMKTIEGTMTKFFQKELGEDHFLQFDLTEVEALKDDLSQKADMASKMLLAGLSINEVREKVWKEEPSDDPRADKPQVLAATGGFNVQVPLPEEAEEEPSEEPQEDKSLAPAKAKIQISPRIEKVRSTIEKQLADEESRVIGKFATSIIDLLIGMTETAIDVMVESDSKSFTVKALPGKRALSRRINRAVTGSFEEDWVSNSIKALEKSIDVGYEQQLQMVFNQAAQRELQVLRARDEDRRRSVLEERGIDSFANITKTHTERIMREIVKGQELNESVTQIARRIAESLGTPGELAGKAETIARTETLTAVSIGQAAAVENAIEVMPGLKKAWLTAGDDRVRDSHQVLDGDIVDADKKFDNGLRHPRDVKSGDPAEVINCRCTLLLVPPEEE